jgi:phosphoenolpyruvate-protein kinase (PTS system EI component)
MPLIIHGKPISPGLAEGTTHIHYDTPRLPDPPGSLSTQDVDREFHHLETSIALITERLLAVATRVEQEMDANLAAVFNAHQQILNDPVLKMELRTEIRENLVSASSAVKTVFQRWERRFLDMESRMAQQKGEDMRDISNFRSTSADRRRSFTAAQARAREPAMTRDGFAIAVMANVGCREDVERAIANGADGIGLYRTEQTYMGRKQPPETDELFDEMQRMLAPAKGKPICVRLLDAGADKPLPFLGLPAETNPALGRRGIRLLSMHQGLMETQLQAILKLAGEFDVSILIPMNVLVSGSIWVADEILKRLGVYGKRPRTP